jgi:biopolymer transport protein ExbB/TolQ
VQRSKRRLQIAGIVLVVLGAIAPIAGVAVTVFGMIRSFNTIATSPETPKPAELAESISLSHTATVVAVALSVLLIALGVVLIVAAGARGRRREGPP